MKKIIVLLIILSSSAAYGNQTDEWIKYLENPPWSSDELKHKNYKSQYLHYDFSQLLVPRSEFLGYIDPNFKRIKIHFKSISKSKPDTYHVKGTSETGSNICDFEGQIVIKEIREFKELHLGSDDEFKSAGFKAQGLLLGAYNFKENPNQKQSGIFEGIVTLYWLVDNNNRIQYDDIELSFSDNYNNNQYVGTWHKYGSHIKKTCNWGEYRIPFSGDLDIGAGEFGVDPKYYNQGWEEFKKD
jgi:hypothetical protein